MKKYLAAMGLITGVVSTQSLASPWQTCGIGAMIFSDNKTVAAISNITTDLGTTALLSYYITPNTCAAGRFIQENYQQIIEETSQGNGPHLITMMDLFEIKSEAREDVINDVRHIIAKNDNIQNFNPEKYFNTVFKKISN